MKMFTAQAQNQSLYVLRFDANNNAWNGTAYEAYNEAHWSLYAIGLTENPGSGTYTANDPTPGYPGYYVVYAANTPGTPAPGDSPQDYHWVDLSILGVAGAAVTGTLTTSQMTSTLVAGQSSQYNGRSILWLTGADAGVAALITAFTPGTGLFTFVGYNGAPIPSAPSAGDLFVVV
jgi:hypothetical protein